MDLEGLINDIKIPTQDDKIYKDESIYDYDTPESEDGLYVCLKTFYGVGKNSLKIHHARTQSRLYLLMKKLKIEKEKADETEEKPIKITKLAIGVEGGFNPSAKNYSFEEQNTLFLYPEGKIFDLSDENVPDKIKLCIANILSADSAFIKEQIQVGTWDGEKRRKTKFADLKQLDNGVKIPPKNWKCSQCDKRDNLWLNLTDGEILCGRKNYDGSGGNNHAAEHYMKTQYPLAVKLGTITPQNSDVYSYPEDDMVEDPNLEKHLLHFGINVNNMEKTEKTMIELEIDANKKVDEWLTIQEANSNLTPAYGSGYTGIENLGNSCYLNSILQVLFAIPDFKNYYYPPDEIFLSSKNPINDLDFQFAKVANGLLSSHYSKKPVKDSHVDQKGIRPNSFKTLVGKNHPEFSTKRQQDAQEFFLHIIDLLEKNHKEKIHKPNLTEVFKFKTEDKIQCLSSNKVSYTERSDYLLSLPIPLEKTLNPKEVEQYLKEKEELNSDDKKVPKVVRPKINLMDCINQIGSEEIVEDFLSPETKTKTRAKKIFRMKTFPDYLMLHMQKFTLDNSWQPKKIECHLELPEILDLSFLRGHGLQPGEELLPESPQTKLVFNEKILSQLVEMGFGLNACKRSLLKTKTDNLETALNWLFEHQNDSDFNDPIEQETSSIDKSKQQFVPDPQGLEALMNMGLSYEYAIKGLKETNNNVENALDWIFTFQNELSSSPKNSKDVEEKVNENFRDGSEKYKLFAFISHMGPSTQSGHYVCHILKDDKWIIHNDSKIAVSVNPPVNLAYMYLFKRI